MSRIFPKKRLSLLSLYSFTFINMNFQYLPSTHGVNGPKEEFRSMPYMHAIKVQGFEFDTQIWYPIFLSNAGSDPRGFQQHQAWVVPYFYTPPIFFIPQNFTFKKIDRVSQGVTHWLSTKNYLRKLLNLEKTIKGIAFILVHH